jgi:DNA polymerase V
VIIPFPEKRKTTVSEIYEFDLQSNGSLLLYTSPVSAGFPSSAEDYTEGRLDLNHHLAPRPEKTFIVKVSGDSMIDAGIQPDDLLIVDQSLSPENGKIVIAVINGELTVKRLCIQKNYLYLMPENPGYPGIEVTPEMDFRIWGVVTSVIHKL